MKPAGLLLLHLDQFEEHEISHACKVHPTRQLQGKDEATGAWNTSAAKEYPPLLLAALARSMVDGACRHSIQHKNIPHSLFFQFLAQYQPVLDPYVEDRDDLGADYVDEAMLPVDRFHLKWQGIPPSLIHRYTTASTLPVYHTNPTV